FFFQAEDGIRDWSVTGVQTCALPIFGRHCTADDLSEVFGMRMVQDRNDHQMTGADLAEVVCGAMTSEAKRDLLLGLVAIKYTQRSEERRVGEEWRCRWTRCQCKEREE